MPIALHGIKMVKQSDRKVFKGTEKKETQKNALYNNNDKRQMRDSV